MWWCRVAKASMHNQSLCSACFLAQIKLWMSVSESHRLSVMGALKRCRCASPSSAFENEGVAPARGTLSPTQRSAGSGAKGGDPAARGPGWPHAEAALLTGSSLCSPGSCSDVSPSLSPFLPASALTYIFFFFPLSAGNHVQAQEKDPFPSLSPL